MFLTQYRHFELIIAFLSFNIVLRQYPNPYLLFFLQLQSAYQDKEDENSRLKHYIDTILLNIVENYPQLLEVKALGGN